MDISLFVCVLLSAFLTPLIIFYHGCVCACSDSFSVSLVMVEMICLEFAWTSEHGRDDTARRRSFMQRANDKMQRVLEFAGTSNSPTRHHHHSPGTLCKC